MVYHKHVYKTLHQQPTYSPFQITVHSHNRPPIHSQTFLHFIPTSSSQHPCLSRDSSCSCCVLCLFSCFLIVHPNGRWNEWRKVSFCFITRNAKRVDPACVSVVKFRSQWVSLASSKLCLLCLWLQSMMSGAYAFWPLPHHPACLLNILIKSVFALVENNCTKHICM